MLVVYLRARGESLGGDGHNKRSLLVSFPIRAPASLCARSEPVFASPGFLLPTLTWLLSSHHRLTATSERNNEQNPFYFPLEMARHEGTGKYL